MSNQATNNRRIAKNTLLLYVRMMFTMGISLYTSRVVLQALGVEDYGIYSVVGGVVVMFTLISNSLTAAISRFITFELGKHKSQNIGEVFSTSIIIQSIIAFFFIVFSEAIGVWFLNTQMTIPESRLYAANWVFQFSIITFSINLISVPYNATIIAYEHIGAFAYIGIIEAVAKLLIAHLIFYSPIDNLIFYAALMCILSLLIRLIYTLYCRKHFPICKLKWKLNKYLLKEIFSFAGWNFIGAGSGVLRDQGVNVLLNIFCGPIVNAARGIAMQINSAVQHFANNFITAINPQITKSFASGDTDYAFKLVFQGAKLTYILLYIVSLPVILETSKILQLWLTEIPDYAVIFVQLSLIYSLSESISYTMVTLMLATGKIRNYQIVVGGCQLLNFPLSYVLLKLGYSPEYTFVISICIAIGCLFLRLFMLKRMVSLPVGHYFRSVILRLVIISVISLVFPLLVVNNLEQSVMRVFATTFTSTITIIFFSITIGCSKRERNFIIQKCSQLINSKLHNFI